ncbi:MAG: dicarboxylate/amino acid:cation symporter [Gammaproteobacteria bacterium]|nr:dicarboxylate/amino acid:cation symporter [Gammaproteobacteria bacterium]MCY4281742.1 dicarboxylate/amino acid:cation symporter [Gammaproteobacteria bacterium]MCY4338034.1 dicarboxylate/amino acid:cation symporter [Gammaproteobacteria bacterium]
MHNNNWLLWALLAAAITGIFCGWFFGQSMLAIAWMGELFLDALKMVIIPLIVAAVISGIASLGGADGGLKRLGGFTVLYYFCTTAIAVLLGLIIVNIIQPGAGITEVSQVVPDRVSGKEDTGFIDIIRSLVGDNIIASAAETKLLEVIVFAILFAAALTTLGERGKPLVAFFEAMNDVMIKIVVWIMYFAPIGIFALVSSKLGSSGGGEQFWQEILGVGKYMLTVIVGLTLHFFVLMTILIVVSRRGRQFIATMSKALITAFGTASSSATLPLTLECAQEAGVDKRAAKFVLPLGSTVNMDGTALYEAVAVMFIAQAYGIHMAPMDQVVIFITATLAAIGAAGIPEAGLVTMVIVLTAVGLPMEGIGLLLAVDWFLDRIRTTVNVWGDSVGSTVIERICFKSS